MTIERIDLSPGASGVLAPGRWLWLRSLAWLSAMLVAVIAILSLQSVARAIYPETRFVLAMAFVSTALAYGVYVVLVRWGERRVPRELALRRAPLELALGFTIGALLFSAVFAILWLSGTYVTVWGTWTDWAHDVRETIGTGLLEELLARAIILRLLARAFGVRWALLLSATAFGAAHLGNPNASSLAALAITIEAGLLLAGFYMVTGRIWMSVGAHAAWNFMQGAVFGAPVSGMQGSGSLFISTPAHGASPVYSGGAFGPEASLPAILVGLTAFVVTLAIIRARQSTAREI